MISAGTFNYHYSEVLDRLRRRTAGAVASGKNRSFTRRKGAVGRGEGFCGALRISGAETTAGSANCRWCAGCTRGCPGRRDRRRLESREERHVVVRCIEIRMIEEIERVDALKRMRKRSWNQEFLRQSSCRTGPGKARGTCCGPSTRKATRRYRIPSQSQGGTPLVPGATNCGEKSLTFSTGLPD